MSKGLSERLERRVEEAFRKGYRNAIERGDPSHFQKCFRDEKELFVAFQQGMTVGNLELAEKKKSHDKTEKKNGEVSKKQGK